MGTKRKDTPLAAAVHRVIWEPQPGPQTLLLTCPVEEVLFGGARGGGKSDALLGDFISHASRWGAAAAGLLIRRTLLELEEIKKRAQQLFTPLGAVFAVKENRWTLPNGATLRFGYLEADSDADRYQGHQYTWIGIDEAGAFKSPAPIDMLRATLRSAAGVACVLRMSANPGGRGHAWLKERFIDPAPPFTPHRDEDGIERVFIPSKLEDNKKLREADPGYERRLQGSGPSWLVKAWRHGDWNVAASGGIFDHEWWKRFKIAPDKLRTGFFQSWDIASKDGKHNDRSVCLTFAVFPFGLFVVDMWAGRLKFPDLKRKVIELAAAAECYDVVIEDTSSGIALLQELCRDTTLGLTPVKPRGSKEERAIASSVLIEQGKVFIPDEADWLADFLGELSAFPAGSHDDVVDALSQGIKYAADNYTFGDGSAGLPFETLKRAGAPAVSLTPGISAFSDREMRGPTNWRQRGAF